MKKKYMFHQFVKLDKGPVNTCISDFLTGDIFQVANTLIEKFDQGAHSEIPDFIESLKEAALIIKVDENAWIPPIHKEDEEKEEPKEVSLLLETEEGTDIDFLLDFLKSKGIHIMTIHKFSHSGGPDETIHGIPVKNLKIEFSICKSLSTITGNFMDINEHTYFHYKKYNSCWGKKIAVTRDLAVRPCIYSGLILGNIAEQDCSAWEDLLCKADQLRKITKSQIVRCKECEFRFVCFDCREIARVKGGDLLAQNPYCSYDPLNGTAF